MARESISKIAYKTLQQSKSIAGFAHKQISSRLMNFILPDSKLENFDIDKELLMQIQNSMDNLREEDWNDAEKNIYPKKLLFDEPGKVVPRAEILEQLWGYPPRRAADLRVVDVYVARLRGKLEPDPRNPELILTVRGIGYASQRVGETATSLAS